MGIVTVLCQIVQRAWPLRIHASYLLLLFLHSLALLHRTLSEIGESLTRAENLVFVNALLLVFPLGDLETLCSGRLVWRVIVFLAVDALIGIV